MVRLRGRTELLVRSDGVVVSESGKGRAGILSGMHREVERKYTADNDVKPTGATILLILHPPKQSGSDYSGSTD